MTLYSFSNAPGLFFLESSSKHCEISEESLSEEAGYKVTIDLFLKYELFKKFGLGFFSTEEEEGNTTDILLKELGYVF